jgi:hypothetical protein
MKPQRDSDSDSSEALSLWKKNQFLCFIGNSRFPEHDSYSDPLGLIG